MPLRRGQGAIEFFAAFNVVHAHYDRAVAELCGDIGDPIRAVR
jgi:hypothetical protein